MTEKTPPLPDVEPCALCRKQEVVSGSVAVNHICDDHSCSRMSVAAWNKHQRRITSELRKAFEAGQRGRYVDFEVIDTETGLRMVSEAVGFDDHLAERKGY